MYRKKIIIIFFVLLLIFLTLNIKRNFTPTFIKKKVIGFQVCGIGNGHLTQSQTVYNILITKYDITLVIVYGRESGFTDNFPKSQVIYRKLYTDKDSISKMNRLKVLQDFFTMRNTIKYEQEYGINLWFNFLVTDILNFRTKQIQIANQIMLNSIDVYLIFSMNNLLTYSYLVTMIGSNHFTDFEIPPLIDIKKIDRNNIEKNMVLCYSVSGKKFPKTLIKIANKNPDYTFHYFLNYELNMEMPKNIILHEQNKPEFKKYLSKAELVLSTAGNQLPQECMFNKITLAIMPCDRIHIEQVSNINRYCKKFKYASKMNKNLNLEKLKKQNLTVISTNFRKSFDKRHDKILNLCNI